MGIPKGQRTMQNLLFIHHSFPGQFVHLASHLAVRPDVQVAAIGAQYARELPGVRLVKYQFNEADVPPGHAFARHFNIDCQRGEQVFYACLNLMASEFVPDVVYAHPGWGESLPLRSLFPDARILAYCELYWRREGQDYNFDPEFPRTDIESRVSLHLQNASTLLALDDCDAGISPIHWQQQTFPPEFSAKIRVIHDGVFADDNPAECELVRQELLLQQNLPGADPSQISRATRSPHGRGYRGRRRACPSW
jgi:hypothetical protein